jgi:hypothetical protein
MAIPSGNLSKEAADPQAGRVLESGIVSVYRSASPLAATVYRRGGVAEAEPALPGWMMPVDDLFPPLDLSR